jgi:PAS domain
MGKTSTSPKRITVTNDPLGATPCPRSRADDWTALILAGDVSPIEECFSAEGATGPKVVWSPAADDLTVAPLRFLHSFWAEHSGAGRIPHARSIDALKLRPALGYIAVLEPSADASDFRYRVFGSIIAAVSGFDMTGRFFSAHPASSYIRDFHLAAYRAVMRRRSPIATVHRPPASLSMTTWKRLVLPLADDEGRIIRLLSGIVPVTTKGVVIASR